jgi:hypothetical protein
LARNDLTQLGATAVVHIASYVLFALLTIFQQVISMGAPTVVGSWYVYTFMGTFPISY